MDVKCSAFLGDFFMKSEAVAIRDQRTNIRVVEVKSDAENSEKILGLFEENREDEVFLPRTNNSAKTSSANLFIFSLILTLLFNFCQFMKT